jgi:phosphocarrier protein HPr
MAQARVTIINPLGLHARAAAKFVKLAQKFAADIRVGRDGQEVGGTSILGLLMLAAGPGDTISIAAEGADADAALTALQELVSGGFGEM